MLANHAEVMMHDLAAGLLVELERLMLTGSPTGRNNALQAANRSGCLNHRMELRCLVLTLRTTVPLR